MARATGRGAGLRSRALTIAISIALVAGTLVAAASILLMQEFPSYPVVSGLSSACGSPTDLTGNTSEIIAGTSGYVRYMCGSGAAFTALGGATGLPRFNLTGTVFTKLYVFSHSTPAGTTCAGGTDAIELTLGRQVNFPTGSETAWDYCGRYVDAQIGSATNFDITWET
ncbi:MAG TPA: hypothetical protein VJ300_05110 [Thermoplasmata archaeon]|nr:hypothetical protein [Thermoplasmata archaeon]